MAPAEAELFALCDQDDRWQPDKLGLAARGARRRRAGLLRPAARRRRRVGAAGDRCGRAARTTPPTSRRCSWPTRSPAPRCCSAATWLELAVPFPETPGMQFHDHWLAVVALAARRRGVRGPAAVRLRPARRRHVRRGLAAARGPVAAVAQDRLRGGRSAYFLGYLPRQAQALTLLERLWRPDPPRQARPPAPLHPGAAFAVRAGLAGAAARARADRAQRDARERARDRPRRALALVVGLASRGATVPGGGRSTPATPTR